MSLEGCFLLSKWVMKAWTKAAAKGLESKEQIEEIIEVKSTGFDE